MFKIQNKNAVTGTYTNTNKGGISMFTDWYMAIHNFGDKETFSAAVKNNGGVIDWSTFCYSFDGNNFSDPASISTILQLDYGSMLITDPRLLGKSPITCYTYKNNNVTKYIIGIYLHYLNTDSYPYLYFIFDDINGTINEIVTSYEIGVFFTNNNYYYYYNNFNDGLDYYSINPDGINDIQINTITTPFDIGDIKGKSDVVIDANTNLISKYNDTNIGINSNIYNNQIDIQSRFTNSSDNFYLGTDAGILSYVKNNIIMYTANNIGGQPYVTFIRYNLTNTIKKFWKNLIGCEEK